jgi:hypothetical protein
MFPEIGFVLVSGANAAVPVSGSAHIDKSDDTRRLEEIS